MGSRATPAARATKPQPAPARTPDSIWAHGTHCPARSRHQAQKTNDFTACVRKQGAARRRAPYTSREVCVSASLGRLSADLGRFNRRLASRHRLFEYERAGKRIATSMSTLGIPDKPAQNRFFISPRVHKRLELKKRCASSSPMHLQSFSRVQKSVRFWSEKRHLPARYWSARRETLFSTVGPRERACHGYR